MPPDGEPPVGLGRTHDVPLSVPYLESGTLSWERNFSDLSRPVLPHHAVAGRSVCRVRRARRFRDSAFAVAYPAYPAISHGAATIKASSG